MIKKSNFFLNLILNTLFPSRCIKCKMYTPNDNFLCEKCWVDINFISNPMCTKCGTPIKFSIKENIICVSCIQNEKDIFFDMARSICIYDGFAKDIILSLKNNDKLQMAHAMAKFIALKFSDIICKNDVILGIPVHKKILFIRKFNHASLIAKNISSYLNCQYKPLILEKIKITKKQSSLSGSNRRKNLKNSFKIRNEKWLNYIKSLNKIILIDDVFTTGSTFNEVSRVIKTANPNIQIICISFAKTIE